MSDDPRAIERYGREVAPALREASARELGRAPALETRGGPARLIWAVTNVGICTIRCSTCSVRHKALGPRSDADRILRQSLLGVAASGSDALSERGTATNGAPVAQRNRAPDFGASVPSVGSSIRDPPPCAARGGLGDPAVRLKVKGTARCQLLIRPTRIPSSGQASDLLLRSSRGGRG